MAFACTINATTYYVRSNGGNNRNEGNSASAAFATIDKALNKAVDGDIIDIDGTFSLEKSLFYRVDGAAITIKGASRSTSIIQGNGNNKVGCLTVGSNTGPVTSTVNLQNLTIQNFNTYTPGTAGAITGAVTVNNGSTLNASFVDFKNNTGFFAGAIYVASSSASLEDCYFYENRVYRNNVGKGGFAGAIYGSSSTAAYGLNLTVSRCLFEGNIADNHSSAIHLYGPATGGVHNVTITNTTFSGNQLVASTNYLTSGNPTPATGSGTIYISTALTTADIKLINNTIAYNSATNTTAKNTGLSITCPANTVTLINNILFSNFDSQSTPVSLSITSTNTLKESRNNITDQSSTSYPWTAKTQTGYASDNVNAVSASALGLAKSLANNGGASKSLGLDAKSVAVNTGYAINVPEEDQRDKKRDNTPDVGAYEYIKK